MRSGKWVEQQSSTLPEHSIPIPSQSQVVPAVLLLVGNYLQPPTQMFSRASV
jgi:hypothetical protein